MAKSYWEKLKDPRWQKKRLQVLESRDWTCERCGNKEDTLHVHHGYYRKGLEPWEYDVSTLHVLCEECHDYATEHLALIHQEIAKRPVAYLADLWVIMCDLPLPDDEEYSAIVAYLNDLGESKAGIGRRFEIRRIEGPTDGG